MVRADRHGYRRLGRLDVSTVVISVVIPAHNEAQVITRCLATLLEGVEPGSVEVIVACNGCTDRTASLAAAASPAVKVVETADASKALALNLGDAVATGFPRVFLDADVELRGRDLMGLVQVMEREDLLAAVPELRVDLAGCSWAIRAYYKVWTALPYVQGDAVGSGVYALSRVGRARFGEFPTIIADDLFVRALFPGVGEQRRIWGTSFTIRPPTGARDLIRVQGRRRAGNIEYHLAYRQTGATPATNRSALSGLTRQPSWWPALAVYAAITVAGMIGGHWKVRFGDLKSWDRDDTARRGPPGE
jgi:glycosyltransferase involved in cell wall biosynthesis